MTKNNSYYVMIFVFTLCLQTSFSQNKKPGIWEHLVAEDQLLPEVTKYYGINEADIKSLNNIGTEIPDSIKYLKIPIAHSSRVAYQQEGNFLLHRVAKKDELHRIAKTYQTNVRFLQKINDLRENSIDHLKYLLVPNSMKLKRFQISRFLSLGYFAGNDYDGETNINYNFFGRINISNEVIKPPFRRITKFNTILGYRHDIGEHFYKNLDRFELKQQYSYSINRWLLGSVLGSLRSQYFNSYLYRNNEKIMISGPFAPAYFHLSVGPSFFKESFNIDFALYEMKATYVNNDELYENKQSVFGIEKGKFIQIEHGVSVRADAYVYNDEKWNMQANFFGFYNNNGFEMELRGDLSYRFNKFINFTFLVEAYYDPEVYDFFQFQNRFALGLSYHTSR